MMTEIMLFESVSAIRSGFGEIARFSQNLEKTLNSLKYFKELETWERLRKPGSMPEMRSASPTPWPKSWKDLKITISPHLD